MSVAIRSLIHARAGPLTRALSTFAEVLRRPARTTAATPLKLDILLAVLDDGVLSLPDRLHVA